MRTQDCPHVSVLFHGVSVDVVNITQQDITAMIARNNLKINAGVSTKYGHNTTIQ